MCGGRSGAIWLPSHHPFYLILVILILKPNENEIIYIYMCVHIYIYIYIYRDFYKCVCISEVALDFKIFRHFDGQCRKISIII